MNRPKASLSTAIGSEFVSSTVRSPRQLAAALAWYGFDLAAAPRGGEVTLDVDLDGSRGLLRIDWMAERGTVQFTLTPPLGVVGHARPLCLQRIGEINAALAVPGFALAAQGSGIVFRLSVPLSFGGLATQVALDVVRTCIETVTGHWDLLAEVALPSTAVSRPPNGAALVPPGVIVIDDRRTGITLAAVEEDRARRFESGRWHAIGVRALRRALTSPACDPVALHQPATAPSWAATWLRQLGFEAWYDEMIVERPLLAPLTVEAPVELRAGPVSPAMAEDAMAGSHNRSIQGMDGAAFMAMVSNSTAARDEGWRMALVAGTPVGLVSLGLPESAAECVATLGFIGVFPAARGKGLSRSLHAGALNALFEFGCRSYRDGTDVDNIPMQRTFFRNGCRLIATVRHSRLLSKVNNRTVVRE